MQRFLVVLGTGGTISGRAHSPSDHVGYRAGEVPVADLLHGIQVPVGFGVEAYQVAQIDSKDMGESVWRDVLRAVRFHLERPEVAGVVVTHGTDTLEETAFLLQRVLSPSKPVALVSAMRPASASSPDGPENLADGLRIAAMPGAQGVLAVCAGRVHSGLDVRKAHNYRLDAFDSGDAGPVGVLEEGRWRQWRSWPATRPMASSCVERVLSESAWPRVEWITNHGGQSGDIVRALMQPLPGARPVQGLVVAGTGNGTLHQDLELALQEAAAAGVTVWRTTRCPDGQVIDGGGSSVPSTPWPPAKARLELTLTLMQDSGGDRLVISSREPQTRAT